MTCQSADVRRAAQGNLIDADRLRGFARSALNLEAVQDKVNDLLFEHVVGGRFHPSVVAETLRPVIDELLDTMTRVDWQIVADEMIGDAREALGIPESSPGDNQQARSTKPNGGAGGRR